jgi:acyl-CoA synthetase (AMP-forming)/AMP-acid ligase II
MVRSIKGRAMRLIDFFDQAALTHPERCAFVDLETSLTYAQMRAFSQQLAAAMFQRGLSDMGRTAVYSPNRVRAFGCVLATLRAGGTWVPVNIRNPVEINAQFMTLTQCEWLFYHSSVREAARLLRQHVPTLKQLICIDRADADIPSVDDLILVSGERALDEVPHDPHRMVTILGSGGTTGRSKAVRWDNLTWETLIAQAAVNMMPPQRGAACVHLCVAPMTHAAGVIAIMLLPFAPTNVILEKADPLEIMQAIARHKVTHLYVPPTVLYAMLAHPRVRDFDYRSLTHFIVAAAPVAPDKLAEAVEVFGPCLCQYYGQVEAPMVATFLSPADVLDATLNPAHRHRLLSCGRPNILTRAAVIDDEGKRVPAGARGELVLQGNLVAPGYFADPAATTEAQRDGWLRTGDIAHIDAEGFVYIVDRKKDMIITGGFNVFSNEVEAAINSHPAVENCAVIGVPDPKWGEAIKAIVVLRPGATASAQTIIELCKARLGIVKAPKSVEFWPELPRTAVGKVQKKEIRARFWAGARRAVN